MSSFFIEIENRVLLLATSSTVVWELLCNKFLYININKWLTVSRVVLRSAVQIFYYFIKFIKKIELVHQHKKGDIPGDLKEILLLRNRT